MEDKQEVRMKENKWKKKRVPITGIRKGIYTAIGSILFVGAIAAGICLLTPVTKTIEEPEYTYNTVADISYRVKLLPNELFASEWLEEGGLYSSRLTDYIEVKFTADFAGSSSVPVSGTYKITAIVEGYHEIKDEKKVTYERKFPIKEGHASGNEQGGASISQVVAIRVQPYKQAAEEAESILGATSARRFYLLFEGDITADTEYGKAEEHFSVPLQIPIQKEDGFYEIPESEAFSKTGQLGSTKEVVVTASLIRIFLIIIWAVVALALILWTWFFTRKPNSEEAFRLQWKELNRKYGSRMVQLKWIDKRWVENGIEVAHMDNLITISEELHQPICYSPGESGIPKFGMLYVPDGDKGYVLFLRNPTPLVVEE